jgi:hypothetical protein
VKYYVALGVCASSEDLDLDKALKTPVPWWDQPLTREELHQRLDLMLDLSEKRRDELQGSVQATGS